jgi:DNA-binding CsgD family transcriptional regulator
MNDRVTIHDFSHLPRGEGRGEGPSFISHLSSFEKRRSRAKRHIAWEQAELASGGLYARYLNDIAHHYPQLTAMELRVAALVKALLPSWKIGEMLGIQEKVVENYRVKIRRKTGCPDKRLEIFLKKI